MPSKKKTAKPGDGKYSAASCRKPTSKLWRAIQRKSGISVARMQDQAVRMFAQSHGVPFAINSEGLAEPVEA
jgi:hypothetical protein